MVEFEDLTGVVRQLPYGPALWDAVRAWPNEKIAQVNTITEFINFSCGGDLLIYAETLLPAAGELFLVLFDFGWDDVARGFFRPLGIRSRLKFRTGKKKGGKRPKWLQKLRFEIPEIGELIGRMLPGAKLLRGRKIGNAQRWFWRLDGIAQRALYYWMIVDITSDFLYNWSTGIMRHERCYRSDAGWFRGGPGFWSDVPNGQAVWAGAPQPQTWGGASPIMGVPVTVKPGQSIDVMASVGYTGTFLPGVVEYEIGISFMEDTEPPPGVRWEAGEHGVPGVAVERFLNNTNKAVSVSPWLRSWSDNVNTLFLFDVIVAAVRRDG